MLTKKDVEKAKGETKTVATESVAGSGRKDFVIVSMYIGNTYVPAYSVWINGRKEFTTQELDKALECYNLINL